MIGTALAVSQAARRSPWTVVTVLAALAVCCGLSWAWGYSVGRSGVPTAVAAEREKQTTAKAREVEDAQQQYREAVRLGDLASGQLRADLAKRDRRISNLKQEAQRAPHFVSSPVCPEPGVVHLSVGAVRLYDAAIGGADQQLPASACGAAGGASAAGAAGASCEQPSAVTVDRFHLVAQRNAELHGECMARLSGLVEFLEARERAAGVNSAKGGGLSQ